MKKLLLTVTLCLACAAAFAQGKVRLVNDSVHCVYFTTDTSRLGAADGALAGQAYTLGAGAQTLRIELWAGTASTSLALVGTSDFNGMGTPGTFAGLNIILPNGFPAQVTTYFTVDVYDAAAGDYAGAAGGVGHYYGTSGLFTALPGTSSYLSIANHGAAPNAASTWADGTFAVGGSLPGATGAIGLSMNPIPEPTTLALAGLAGAALMIFRRRK
jgi:hypothetical protein